MRDVLKVTCRDCDKSPSFGLEMGKPIYCATHKLPVMWNVVSLMCEFGECRTVPSFGIDRPRYCSIHKTDDMTNFHMKRCKTSECQRAALYALVGNKPELCSTHATTGMIDVVNQRCSDADCSTFASYGFPAQSRTACAQHKVVGMIMLQNSKCVKAGCGNPATHGIGNAKWCEVHALPTHQNLVERKCTSCGLLNILDADNKCVSCGTSYTAAEKITLQKQKEVKAVLDADPDLNKYEFYDQRIRVEQDVLCTTTHKPDFAWDQVTHLVVLEVDESQHRGPNYQCEKKRMRALAEDSMRPVVFVRFNPDMYKINGVVQRSGYCERYSQLKKWLMYVFEPENVKGVIDVIYLYYNDFNSETAATVVLLDKLE